MSADERNDKYGHLDDVDAYKAMYDDASAVLRKLVADGWISQSDLDDVVESTKEGN